MLNAIGIPLKIETEKALENTPSSFVKLNINDETEVLESIDALMKAAYLFRVPVFYYSLQDISGYKNGEKLPALYWDGGSYNECRIDLPKYTEICCGTIGLKSFFPEELSWLTENTVLTDGFGLPKYQFQKKLLFSKLSQYAVPTIVVNSFKDILTNAALFDVSFLKPANGRKALGATRIERRDGTLYFSTPEMSGKLTEEALSHYYKINGFEPNALMLIEPCLNILNDDGRAVDFRCLVSLNGEGKWQNVLTYARIGGTGVASNFSHGGSLNFARDVLEELIPGQADEKLKEINDVALKVAALVRKESPNPVSWLGLDICIDRPSNQIYVIEANSKPGTKLVGPWPLALTRAQYFKYILENGMPEK